MSYEEHDARRLRDALVGQRNVVERKMMGGLVFMIGGHMCVGLSRGGLMVRVGRDGYAAALAQRHAEPMTMSTRSPRGFVRIRPEGWRTEAALAAWVRRALDFVATLPVRPG